ncbi:MAG: DNA adenine methylase, partial [Chloroflexota bacterium]
MTVVMLIPMYDAIVRRCTTILDRVADPRGFDHLRYRRRSHAAVRSHDYVFSQLIPYIGNKRKLLPLIAGAIHHTGCRTGAFVDLFTGSTVVARMAKSMGFSVLANDWEPYSFEIALGSVALSRVPEFRALGGTERVLTRLNTLPPLHGYVATHLCPQDDERPDHERERQFFTRQNGERIDAIRETIAEWQTAGLLDRQELAFLLCGLTYAVSYVSNTSGVFKAFHRGWGGPPGTALYRIRSQLRLRPPILYDNGLVHRATASDAQTLAPHLTDLLGARPDIVYLDPPYNQHPYGSNYHVLNTVALWDKPAVSPTITGRGDKSAIRRDWRDSRRSTYNSSQEALPAFRALINSIDAHWILLSYSTDGNMSLRDVLDTVAQRGAVAVFTQPYKRYRVSTPRMSHRPRTMEILV